MLSFTQEYADSLQNSGIHGAVMVLDPTFSADSMAKALDIPNNKHMIHRHLYEEMKVLLNPARCVQLLFQSFLVAYEYDKLLQLIIIRELVNFKSSCLFEWGNITFSKKK